MKLNTDKLFWRSAVLWVIWIVGFMCAESENARTHLSIVLGLPAMLGIMVTVCTEKKE